MSLRVKFNVVMLASFITGLVVAAIFLDRLTNADARTGVLSEAALMMGEADATVHYNDSQVAPLLLKQTQVQFLPQAIPFYAAQQTLDTLTKSFPGYTFRQPALNPTNPLDRPAAWEMRIINTMLAQPQLRSLVTDRPTATGRVLSYSKPIRVTSSCLACHSTPTVAPASMVDVYGADNGFGWTPGSIVGAEVVSVPEQLSLRQARHNLYSIMAVLCLVFLMMLILLNSMLHFFIIAPVRRVSRLADEVSLGNMDVAELDGSRSDEIGSLSRSFNRMRRSLAAALKLLEE
jgi:HAMP domain-containing protein